MNQQQMTNTLNQLYDYEAIKRITLNLLHCHHSRVIETINIVTNNHSNTQKDIIIEQAVIGDDLRQLLISRSIKSVTFTLVNLVIRKIWKHWKLK